MRTVVLLLPLLAAAALADGAWMPSDPFTGWPFEALTRDTVEEALTETTPFDCTTRTVSEVGGYVGDDPAHGYQTLLYAFDETGRLIEISFLYVLTDTDEAAIDDLLETADRYKPRVMAVGDIGSTFELVIDPEAEPRLKIVILVP
jgi:hypothetical protein